MSSVELKKLIKSVLLGRIVVFPGLPGVPFGFTDFL